MEGAELDAESPFLYLTLDLPQAPLYRDELLQNIIPQVPLGDILSKFNGTTEKEYKTYNANIMKRSPCPSPRLNPQPAAEVVSAGSS